MTEFRSLTKSLQNNRTLYQTALTELRKSSPSAIMHQANLKSEATKNAHKISGNRVRNLDSVHNSILENAADKLQLTYFGELEKAKKRYEELWLKVEKAIKETKIRIDDFEKKHPTLTKIQKIKLERTRQKFQKLYERTLGQLSEKRESDYIFPAKPERSSLSEKLKKYNERLKERKEDVNKRGKKNHTPLGVKVNKNLHSKKSKFIIVGLALLLGLLVGGTHLLVDSFQDVTYTDQKETNALGIIGLAQTTTIAFAGAGIGFTLLIALASVFFHYRSKVKSEGTNVELQKELKFHERANDKALHGLEAINILTKSINGKEGLNSVAISLDILEQDIAKNRKTGDRQKTESPETPNENSDPAPPSGLISAAEPPEQQQELEGRNP